MPLWLLLIVASLATYRLTRLIVKDTFPPVLWLRDHFVGGWRPLTADEQAAPVAVPWRNQTMEIDGVMNRWITRWKWVPAWLSDLLSCPWCASGWISLAVITAVAFTVGVPAPVLIWPAVWAAGSLIAGQRWS